LKERTKELLRMQVSAGLAVSDLWAGGGAKVFWFFFSKKNRFLTLYPA
jgi:hypothetical protein